MLAGILRAPIVVAFDASILLPGLLLAGVLLLGAAAIALAGSWRRRTARPESQTSDQLAQYRSLYEQGVISQEEYNRLRSHLGGELRRVLEVPGKPASLPSSQGVAPVDPPVNKPDTGPDAEPREGIRMP